MIWSIISLVIAVLLMLFAIFSKKKVLNKQFGKIKIWKKVIAFATPHRAEIVLLSLYFFFFFVANQAQNKFIDLGLDYKVIVFWKTSLLALDVWMIFLILFHVALVGLFLMSLRSKSTYRVFDIVVGLFALFGVAILLAGVVVQIYSDTIHFLFMTFRSIDFYHIGVYIEIFAGFYWAITK